MSKYWPFTIWRQRHAAREQRIVDLIQQRGEMSSYDIGKQAKLSPASLYPSLQRFEHDGRLTSRWGVATADRGWLRPRLYSLGEWK